MLTWVDRARDHGVGGIFIAGGSSGWRQRLGCKDVLAVIQVIVTSEFSVDVVSLYCHIRHT